MKFGILISIAIISVACVFPANASAHEQTCNQELAQLTARQKTFEKQLASIPQNLEADGKIRPNRLYEQIMLENITALSRIKSLKQKCENTPQIAGFETNQILTDMRSELSLLKTLVAELTLENRKLSNLIERLSENTKLSKTSSPCTERKQLLTKKLDALKSLGYDPNHPDIINVSHQLDAVTDDCAPQPETMTANEICLARTAEVKIKLDQLRSLGFKDDHPDIKNVTRQLEAVGNECLAAS